LILLNSAILFPSSINSAFPYKNRAQNKERYSESVTTASFISIKLGEINKCDAEEKKTVT
jgi:hypothetical protein